MSGMTSPQRRLVWAALGLVVTGILLAFIRQELTRPPATTASAPSPALPVYGTLPAFQLTNQLARPISLDTYRGQVWLADIIFTRCPGPCAQMTARLADLQAALPDDPRIRLVTLTTDPEFDTPAVLAQYGRRMGASNERWDFLTGTKPEIRRLAIEGLKLTSLDKEPEARESDDDLFIHSTNLVLVDQQGRLRASFQLIGLDSDEDEPLLEPFPWEEVKRTILAAVNQLLQEQP
jgi:protein SCO1